MARATPYPCPQAAPHVSHRDLTPPPKVIADTVPVASGSAALRALPPDLQSLALHSTVTYAPHPYSFISSAKAHSTGLVCHSDGLEKRLDELPAWDAGKLLTLPLVWTNPVTGEKSLMVHGACVWKLQVKRSEEDDVRVVEDLAEVRSIIYS